MYMVGTSDWALCTTRSARDYFVSLWICKRYFWMVFFGFGPPAGRPINAQPPRENHDPTAMSRMLVFIDGSGFICCLGLNNTLCWWRAIFIIRAVCTAAAASDALTGGRAGLSVCTPKNNCYHNVRSCSFKKALHTHKQSKIKRIRVDIEKVTFNNVVFFCRFVWCLFVVVFLFVPRYYCGFNHPPPGYKQENAGGLRRCDTTVNSPHKGCCVIGAWMRG